MDITIGFTRDPGTTTINATTSGNNHKIPLSHTAQDQKPIDGYLFDINFFLIFHNQYSDH